jgi:mycothiol synthase
MPPVGFTARPGRPDDVPAVAALITEVDRTYLEEPDQTGPAEVADWWKRLDPARDVRVVEDADGILAAAGMLDERQPGSLDLDAYVRPACTGRGLGSLLIDWVEGEAAARGRPVVRASALAADAAAKKLIAARGFAPVRHFYRMLIDLDAAPPPAGLPPGFELSVFQPGDERALHDVLEEAFAEHWGFEPESLEQWQESVFGRSWWDPTLVYLVREGDGVVAAAINAVRFGMGWIGTLGTRKRWRGRGLGRVLLVTAFAEFHRRGESRVGLAVDAGNETGATRLYENVGMRVAWQADVYEKHR